MFTSADVEGTEKTVGEMEALWDAADAVEGKCHLSGFTGFFCSPSEY